MIDARNIFRKVTRKDYDFSPEQEQNILAMVWLCRGRADRYLERVAGYCRRVLHAAEGCFKYRDDKGDDVAPLPAFIAAFDALRKALQPFLKTLPGDARPTLRR